MEQFHIDFARSFLSYLILLKAGDWMLNAALRFFKRQMWLPLPKLSNSFINHLTNETRHDKFKNTHSSSTDTE